MVSFRKILLLLFIPLIQISLAENFIVTIHNPEPAMREWLLENRINIISDINSHHLEVYVDQNLIGQLANQGIAFDIIRSETQLRRDLEGYRDYSQMLEELQLIADTYPDITQLTTIGQSAGYHYYLEGNDNYIEFQHEIWCLKLSDAAEFEEDEPNVYLSAAIHARETIGLEVAMNVLYHLLENYGIDDEITELVNNNQIWFLPLLNPDGQKLTIDGSHLLHRKNMRDNNENGFPDTSTTDGVDLNRNFGYVWGDNGSSNNYYSSLYHGPFAWSEPESAAIRDFLRERKFWGGITYHSSGQYVLYPLGHLPGANALDHEIMHDLAATMASTIPLLSGSGIYDARQAVDFNYTCQGTMGDWGYAEERLFSYTIELATMYIPPLEQISQICDDNLEAALIMINRSSNAMLTGTILDHEDNPLIADVYIDEIDNQEGMSIVEPVRSGDPFGRYNRMLIPGSYTARFEKEGYYSQQYNSVTITNESVTELNIQLLPFAQGDLNLDGIINVTDIVILISYIFNLSEPTGFEIEQSDLIEDGILDILDVVAMVDIIISH